MVMEVRPLPPARRHPPHVAPNGGRKLGLTFESATAAVSWRASCPASFAFEPLSARSVGDALRPSILESLGVRFVRLRSEDVERDLASALARDLRYFQRWDWDYRSHSGEPGGETAPLP